jgi:hypothetical protein
VSEEKKKKHLEQSLRVVSKNAAFLSSWDWTRHY